MQPELNQALASGAVVLTATRRLTRWLLHEHDESQRRAGRAAWESPRIAPFGDWLGECWQALADGGGAGSPPAVLLSGAQAQAVWEEMLARDPAAAGVLNLRATAGQALAAWELWHQWQTPPLEREPDLTPDCRAWLRWGAAYRRLCQERGWLDGALLPARVAAAFGAGALEAPPALLLAGFDRLPPAQAAVVDALRGRGAAVTMLPPPAVPSLPVLAPQPDAEEEAWAVARWARRALEEGEQGPIGIVVPELGERRAQIVRCLRDALIPHAGTGTRSAPPFNLSQGVPLADIPVARSALLLLRLWHERIPLDVAGHALRTPFLAGGEREAARRGLLEARLRELGEVEPRTAALLRLAAPGSVDAEPRPYHAPVLANALRGSLEVKARQPRSQPAGAWARAFHEALQALGWPGERPLDSAEHQAREKWQELLETLATLERVLPPLAWGDALARLGALAADTAFQPQSPPAPVQVLGLLESGGLSFARLWVLGLDDEAWPPPARPNPFLPLALQRRLDLPNASAAQALDFARRHTQRLRQAAPVAVFSHALSRGDTPLRASPLVADLPLAAPGSLPLSSLARPAERVQAAGGLRPWEDNAAPPLTGTASGAPASGGTGIFKDMAACPFRAFAKHRLRAEALEQPVPGLGPDRRGQLAHRALEFLWRALGGHAALLALTPEQARTLADETAAAAIGDCERRWRRDLSPALAALERQRLAALLLETLEVERGRAPFRVAAREEEREATLGGVTVRMRIDRMDELPGGGLLLLDYKTGAADVRSWFGPRPDEPQLPLYALAAGERVSGLAFFAVKRGNTGFRGLAESPDAFPGAKEFAGYEAKDAPAFAGRAEVFASWRGALEDLGRRFAAGDARVDPKDPRQTCRYCELGALCRITAPLADGEQGTEPDSAGDGHDAA